MFLAPEAIWILLVTLVVVILTWLHHARTMGGRIPERRPLPALDALRAALAQGAETGRALHISPGAGLIGGGEGTRGNTAEMIAGLNTAERVAAESALNGAPVLVSSADAVAHLALRGAVRQAYQVAGQTQDYDASRVQLLAQSDDLAYAAGVTALYARQPLEASVLIGSFGQEFLLIGEDGAQRNLPQVAGTTGTVALPLMQLTTPNTLIGEEIFAAESYLTPQPSAQARLLTQDVLRTVAIVLVLGGFVYGLAAQALGLPPLPGL